MPKYKQQKVLIKIPKGYTSRERRAISEDIIDFMIERTQKGKDKNNKTFPKYSKAYKESRDFSIAGKTSKVDLTLTEEMLSEIKHVSDDVGELEIGFDGRRNGLNGKVEGNRKGTYGNKRPVVRGGRDFLGITKRDLKKILNRFPLNDKTELRKQLILSELAREKAKEIVDDIGLEG